MSDSNFIAAFNDGNTAFGQDCGEQFILLTGGKSTPLMALSIDEVTDEATLTPGGTISLGDVLLYVLKSVWDGADIQDGAKLIVRGKRMRFNKPMDDGDNMYTITCGPTGAKVSAQ